MRARLSHSSARTGFSLVELMVALAILITVITSVVALYAGAIRIYRTSQAAIDNREIGNTTLNALARDLETAFTAREFGQFFQFHGTPFGFMYVGSMEDGQLGRVTYVVNRLDAENDFQTDFTVNLPLLLDRALAQAAQWAIDDGILNSNCTGNNPYAGISYPNGDPVLVTPTCDGVMFARKLVESLIFEGHLPGYALEAYDNAVNQALLEMSSGLLTEFKYGSMNAIDPSSGQIVSIEPEVIEVITDVETAYMLRYEQPGVTDIDSFEMPPDPNNPVERMKFPRIHPSNLDDTFLNSEEQVWYTDNCVFVDGSVEQTSMQGQTLLSCLLYSSILAPDEFDIREADLRMLYTGESLLMSIVGYRPSRFVNDDTIETILDAQRRTIWLSMLAGDDPLGLIDMDFNYIPLLFSPDGTIGPENWFDAWTLDDSLNNGTDNNKDPEDFIIAERIAMDARIVVSALGDPVFENNLRRFDAMGISEFFVYADTDEEYEPTYNSAGDIPGYDAFRLSGTGQTAANRMITFDTLLGEEFRGIRTDASTGSPVTPSIPKLVSPRFWIMAPEPVNGAPEFREYFDRVIQVPSAATRSLPAQFIANSG